MAQLEEQLAKVFSRGLDTDPELRASLEEALGSSRGNSRPTPNDKATKAESNYREAENDDEECGKCEYFRDPGRCAIVSGSILPDWVCDYFEELENDGKSSSPRASD